MLVPLAEGFKAEQVAPALAAKIKTLPEQLRRTLTDDRHHVRHEHEPGTKA